MKKVLKIILIFFLFIVLSVIATLAIFLSLKLNKINYENVSVKDIEINEGIEDELEEYTNIALLGLDARDDTFANSRSDCIMIISINNKTKDVNIVSIYRDSYLQIDDIGLDKVTHAYAYGKAPLALSTINKNLDLNITQYLTINFESVKKIVDSIGGVSITLTSAEAARIPGITSAGTYNLNGEQALTYGRIRKIDNDYVRTERMRNVLIKIFEKAKTFNYIRLNNLIDKLLPSVSTNITRGKMLSYASKINQYKIKSNFGWPYQVRGITLNAWYAVPVTLEENVAKLHKDIFNDEEYEASKTVKEISNRIIEKTGYK